MNSNFQVQYSPLSQRIKKFEVLNFVAFLQQHITQRLPDGQGVFAQVQRALEHIQDLRNNRLNHHNLDYLLSVNSNDTYEYANQVMLYFRYLRLLQPRFNIEEGAPDAIAVPFTWYDSFNAQAVFQCQSITFEMTCVLYNYAISLFCSAHNKIDTSLAANDVMSLCRMFRQVVWAVKEGIVPNLRQLPESALNAHTDLSAPYLSVISNLSLAFTYYLMYQRFLQDEAKYGVKVIAEVAGECAYHFRDVVAVVTQQAQADHPLNEYKLWAQRIKIIAVYRHAEAFAIASLKMQEVRLQENKNAQLAGHIAHAIAHLRTGKRIVQECMANAQVYAQLTAAQKARLEELNNSLTQPMANLDQRNREIYKLVVPEVANEIRITDQGLVATPRKPDELDHPLPYYSDIIVILTADDLRLIHEATALSAQTVSRLLATAQARTADIVTSYQRYNVQDLTAFLESSAVLLSQTIPAEIAQPLGAIRERGLTYRGAAHKIEVMKQLNTDLLVTLEHCDNQLAAESVEDQNLRVLHQEKWTPQPSSNFTQDLYEKINKSRQNLQQTANANSEVEKKYAEIKSYAQLSDLSNDEIVRHIPKNDAQQFLQENEQHFEQLITVTQKIEQTKGRFHQIPLDCGAVATENNFRKAVIDAKTQNVTDTNVLRQRVLQIFAVFDEESQTLTQKLATDIQALERVADILQQRLQMSRNAEQQSEAVRRRIAQSLIEFLKIMDLVDQALKYFEFVKNVVEKIKTDTGTFVQMRQQDRQKTLKEISDSQADNK